VYEYLAGKKDVTASFGSMFLVNYDGSIVQRWDGEAPKERFLGMLKLCAKYTFIHSNDSA
jgi:hypothetical protein